MKDIATDDASTENLRRPVVQKSSRKFLVLAAVIVIGGLLFWKFGDAISLTSLASRETGLRMWQTNAPLLTAVTAVAVYVVVAGLSLPGAVVLTLAYGWFFGFWQGLVVVSFGSTGGALVAFLISRYLLRDWVQEKMQGRLGAINDAFEREGAFYLFTLRLVPAVPFFVINAVMGLTRVRALTFWWVSQLGMLPGTVAYVYAGSTVPSLQTLARDGVGQVINGRILLAFVVLGILPLAIKRGLALFRRVSGNTLGKRAEASEEA